MFRQPDPALYPQLVLRITFKHLDETEFEDFCLDLLDALGFVNLDWRKGTGKKTSPRRRS